MKWIIFSIILVAGLIGFALYIGQPVIIVVIVVVIFALYWGIRGAYYDYHYGESNKKSEHIPLPSDHEKKIMLWSIWMIYDFIFHAVGFLAGCTCSYVLIQRVGGDCHFQKLEIADMVLFIFSVLGLTGHLPQTLYGFVKAFGMLASAAADRLTDKK